MIVRQSYWDNSYLTYRFQRLQPNDPTRMLIEKYIPYSQKNEEAFEIGCFPGRFLIEIGQKGYTINGCDITPRIEKDLPDWCIRNSCKVGKFENKNYLAFIDKKYDLVASFGFIEHFKNYEEIFLQHCNMVKSRGILIVQYPNFRGLIQKILVTFKSVCMEYFFMINQLHKHKCFY
jgi:SAM-dependent methyltransferase